MSDFDLPQSESGTDPALRAQPRASQPGNPSAHEQIVSTLRGWVEGHPAPEFPALSVAELGEYSPRQLYDGVREKNEVGQFFEVLIVHGARTHPEGLPGVLKSFLSDAAEGAPEETPPESSKWDPKRMGHHFDLDE